MADFCWKEELSVGVPEIDAQHKRFIEALNTFHAEVQAGRGQESFRQALDSLFEYANTHFKTEEEYMQRANYPELGNHRSEHVKFQADIGKFLLENFMSTMGGSAIPPETVLKLLDFIIAWLEKHLVTEDKLYIPYLKEIR